MDFNNPEIFSIGDNPPEHFKQFIDDIENYFIATESYKKLNNVHTARLKNRMGKEAFKLHNSLAKDIENKTVQSMMDILGECFLPEKSEIMDVFHV